MKQLVNLPYKAVFVSSQTDQNPIGNIMSESAFSDGWISIPQSSFPQILVLDFDSMVCCSELRFVSHQTKIASEIEMLIAPNASNWSRAEFSHLETFKFTNNSQNDYKAREIRVAHLPKTRFRFLQIRVISIYQNKFNKKNQVGIVSLTAKGIIEGGVGDEPEIALLEQQKLEAIECEDFDKAKELKERIDQLREGKKMMEELIQRKEDAIKREDYDLAKRIKNQINEFLNRNSNPPAKPHNPVSEDHSYHANQFSNDQIEPEMEPVEIIEPKRKRNDTLDDFSMIEPPKKMRDDFGDNRPIHPMKVDLYAGNDKPLAQNNYDDELFQPNNSRNNSFDEIPVGKPPPRATQKKREQSIEDRPIKKARQENDDLIEFNNESQEDIADPLEPHQKQEAEAIINVFGEQIVQEFYSKSINLKIHGIEEISRGIKSQRSMQQNQTVYQRFIHMLRHHLKDNVAAVYTKTVEEIMGCTDKMLIPPEIIKNALDPHKNQIFSKLGNKNARMSQISADFFIWAAKNQSLGIVFVAPTIMSPLKPPIQWTQVLVRLEIIGRLLHLWGILETIFEPVAIIQFTFASLDSPKMEVRKMSCEVLSSLSDMGYENTILKMLQSTNLPLQTKKMVENEVQERK